METFLANIFAYLQAHYQYVLIALGLGLIIGTYFDWDWLAVPSSKQKNSLIFGFIVNSWGRKGIRAINLLSGILLIICALIMLIYDNR